MFDKAKKLFKTNAALIVTVIALGLVGGIAYTNHAKADEVVTPPAQMKAPTVVVVEAEEIDECSDLKAEADATDGMWEHINAKLKALSCKVFGPETDQSVEVQGDEGTPTTPAS